ncbi:hypothetical protein DFJ77DRAFT_97573 [Powellomyces hirtus]|nr:hypothetical protein DFJ77DRAFT_97573 [Powellomyces hirtus]
MSTRSSGFWERLQLVQRREFHYPHIIATVREVYFLCKKILAFFVHVVSVADRREALGAMFLLMFIRACCERIRLEVDAVKVFAGLDGSGGRYGLRALGTCIIRRQQRDFMLEVKGLLLVRLCGRTAERQRALRRGSGVRVRADASETAQHVEEGCPVLVFDGFDESASGPSKDLGQGLVEIHVERVFEEGGQRRGFLRVQEVAATREVDCAPNEIGLGT